MTYLFAGRREGWNLSGLARTDDPDGYSRFIRKDGTVQAVVLTALVGDEK